MPQDKFGIEIQHGDILAMVDTYKDCPPVLCVADSGFTPQYTRLSCIYLYGEVSIQKDKYKTKHLIILSEEQVEGLINRMVIKRLEYQEEIRAIRNDNFPRYTEEEIRAEINELIEYSRELKENL